MTPLHAGAIRRELLAIRAVGCSVSFDKVSPGAGVVAVMVPTPVHETPLAIGIGAPSALIRANAANYGALLREALGRFCTPTVLGGGVFVPRNGRIKGVGA
jgi:DNA-binding IclR family transcriptional regulator